MQLADKVAIVTGAARGLGRAYAEALASEGAAVVAADISDCSETVAAIEAAGGKAQAYSASVDDYEQNAEMVAAIEADHGPIAILINNAGIASRGQSVEQTDPAELQRVVATHAFGPHYLSKLVIPKMRTLDRGDIVMISPLGHLAVSGRRTTWAKLPWKP